MEKKTALLSLVNLPPAPADPAALPAWWNGQVKPAVERALQEMQAEIDRLNLLLPSG